MRAVGLDVHLDFSDVAIVEDGEVRSAGRIETTPERLELFGGVWGPDPRHPGSSPIGTTGIIIS